MQSAITSTLFIISAVANSILGEELNVPKTLFSRQSYCAGKGMRISCADDGAPFADYIMTSVVAKIYTSSSPMKVCKGPSRFPNTTDLCSKDYRSGAYGDFDGLGYQVMLQCSNKKECFIRLPKSTQEEPSNACGDKTYFYGAEIEVRCTEPIPVNQIPVEIVSNGRKQPAVLPQIFLRRRRRAVSFNNKYQNSGDQQVFNDKSNNNNQKSPAAYDQHSAQNFHGYGGQGNANSRDTSKDKNLNSHNHKNSRDNSKNTDTSGEFARAGGKHRGYVKKITSYTSDGRPVYGSQVNAATRSIAGTLMMVIVAACAGIMA